jgi:hypothetical protein
VNAIDPLANRSMTAVGRPLKMRPLTSESRLLRRGSLGGVSGRSREGRFLVQVERQIEAQIGEPSAIQRLLIRRLARAMLRLELLDEKSMAGTGSDHDGRVFSALSNVVRLTARELNLKAPATNDKLPNLGDYLTSKAGAR